MGTEMGMTFFSCGEELRPGSVWSAAGGTLSNCLTCVSWRRRQHSRRCAACCTEILLLRLGMRRELAVELAAQRTCARATGVLR